VQCSIVKIALGIYICSFGLGSNFIRAPTRSECLSGGKRRIT